LIDRDNKKANENENENVNPSLKNLLVIGWCLMSQQGGYQPIGSGHLLSE